MGQVLKIGKLEIDTTLPDNITLYHRCIGVGSSGKAEELKDFDFFIGQSFFHQYYLFGMIVVGVDFGFQGSDNKIFFVQFYENQHFVRPFVLVEGWKIQATSMVVSPGTTRDALGLPASVNIEIVAPNNSFKNIKEKLGVK